MCFLCLRICLDSFGHVFFLKIDWFLNPNDSRESFTDDGF